MRRLHFLRIGNVWKLWFFYYELVIRLILLFCLGILDFPLNKSALLEDCFVGRLRFQSLGFDISFVGKLHSIGWKLHSLRLGCVCMYVCVCMGVGVRGGGGLAAFLTSGFYWKSAFSINLLREWIELMCYEEDRHFFCLGKLVSSFSRNPVICKASHIW